MTNEQIIFAARLDLMKEGKIKGTGEFMKFEGKDGQTSTVEIPEVIHTYATWAKLGRQVKKGEHALAKVRIWKRTDWKKQEDDAPEELPRMFMKTAFFFSEEQTEEKQGQNEKQTTAAA